jgi:predicted amidophosphoribosyltransferase
MLAWSNRTGNVQHAFRVRRPKQLAGRHILLVDDVFTSGATAAELTRCLLKAGASRVTIAVAARGTGVRDHRP